MVVSPNMVLSCTSLHTFQIHRADILNRASAQDKTEARAEKRKIKIKEMIFEGTYVHKRVEQQIPRWDWYYYRHFPYMHNEPCACADCSLMGQDLVSSPDMFELIPFRACMTLITIIDRAPHQ
jgi:hypothetical protein